MNVGTLTSIHRYPVKSMQGETVPHTQIGPNGIPGNRAWAIRNERRGGIQGAKQIPGLMGCSARFLEEPVYGATAPVPEIKTPGGDCFRADAKDAASRLSRQVDTEVTLWPLLPAEAVEHYRRVAPDPPDRDMQEAMRAMVRETGGNLGIYARVETPGKISVGDSLVLR